MEKEIKKLKELADEFAEFVGRSPRLRTVKYEFGREFEFGNKIETYFSEDANYSITIDRIIISEWSKTINIPLNYTAKDLEEIYNKARKYLDEEKEKIIEKCSESEKEEIKALRKRLAELVNKNKQ